MRNGHFSEDCREFIITDPHTPRPWHNYLFNDMYLVNLTQHGTGASFYQPVGEGLRSNVTEDRDGNGGPRFVYLRDNETGSYWTISGAPEFKPMDNWECRVGLGYQINQSRNHDIEASWRVFVPQQSDPCELWTITVTNRSDKARRISIFPYLEMHLTGGSTLMDFIAVLGGHYESETGAVFGINSCVKFPPMFKALLASDHPAAAATVSRDAFVGPYRDYHNPIAVEHGDVHNPEAGTEWLGASLRHDLVLYPGTSMVINCLVAVVPSVENGRELIKQYLAHGEPQRLFDELRAANDKLLSVNTVETPDPQFDRWINIWLKHQLGFVARWGRVIGRGFRDILQDIMGHRITDPARARRCILEVFSKQFPSGKCIRAWHLPTNQLDLQDYADSPSWMIMALSAYLKETADFSVLEQRVPFLNPDNPGAQPTSDATVWEHVVLAQRHLLRELGNHGLSKMYYGDWCDTMNGVGASGRGESVMLSMQVVWGCELLEELATHLAKPDVASEMRSEGQALAASINKHSWDGQWFVRAFDDDGVAVGSSNPPPRDNGEGKIFLNAQSWAVISGVADKSRTEKCISSAQKYLNTGYGMILNWPVFTALRPRIGQMTAMSPGFYENGSVYVHGNCFWIFALAKAGRGEEAWEALRAVLPDTDNKPNADTEPFAIPNYYIGPNVIRRAQRNLYLSGWRTGSAAWLLLTGLEWILGIRAEYDGLVIDPHLGTGWKKCRVVRQFRGDTYDISLVRNEGPARIVEISVDGKVIEGALIKPFGDHQLHHVRVAITEPQLLTVS